jgi:ribosome-associated heat shock protein Hsp15
VRIGDEVSVREAGFERIVVVNRLLVKRVGAAIAAETYLDITPPPPPREEVPFVPIRDLEKLRGRDDD